MIKATLVVPTYRRPDQTACCLERVLTSRYLGARFALHTTVVDSSPDNDTGQAVSRFARPLELRYIKLEQQTLPGTARNIAVQDCLDQAAGLIAPYHRAVFGEYSLRHRPAGSMLRQHDGLDPGKKRPK